MGKADLHMHTTYSFDGTATIRGVLKAASQARLDVIAITDHDEIRGALEARDLSTEYGIQVIPASEISTREGHVVALFIEKSIPKGLPLIETLIRIGDQGGIAIAAHPNHPMPNSLPLHAIASATEHAIANSVLKGIEVINMNPTHSPFNNLSQQAAAQLPLACIGSSDAHLASMVSAGITHFVGKTADELRVAIENTDTVAEQFNQELPARIFSRWLWHFGMRKLGWATGNLGADLPLAWTRLKTA